MKAVYILASLVALGLGTWIAILVVNGIRRRIANRNARKQRGYDK